MHELKELVFTGYGFYTRGVSYVFLFPIGIGAPQRWKRNAVAVSECHEYMYIYQPSSCCRSLPAARARQSPEVAPAAWQVASASWSAAFATVGHGTLCHASRALPEESFSADFFFQAKVDREKTPKVIDRKTNESCGIHHSNKKTDEQECAVTYWQHRNVAVYVYRVLRAGVFFRQVPPSFHHFLRNASRRLERTRWCSWWYELLYSCSSSSILMSR